MKVSRRQQLRNPSARHGRQAVAPPRAAVMLSAAAAPAAAGPRLDSDPAAVDEHLLQRAKVQWQHGDWDSLDALDGPALQRHPDRAKLALLAAAGRLQRGDTDEARRLLRLAIDWGCSKRLVSQVLVAGVHVVLGRARSLGAHEARARQHFEASIAAVDPGTDVKLLGHARSVREMVRLGMLPQAAAYVSDALAETRRPQVSAAHAKAHQKVLDLEVEWLRDRVVQLQKRADRAGAMPVIVPAPPAAAAVPGSVPATATDRRYHGLNGLDRKLESYLDFNGGYFVELGANDGVAQSNTLYFERERGWRGVLIEPILHNFIRCRQNRSAENHFVCAACVSSAHPQPFVKLAYANLMTTPLGLESDIDDPLQHAESGQVYLPQGESTVEVMASARTLGDILKDAGAPPRIDLLSLDVEGAELDVLKGLDHASHQFSYMLIESRNPQRLAEHLAGHGYLLIDKLSQHDYLFTRR